MTDREVVLGTGNAPGPQRGRVREFVANRSGTQRARRRRGGARPPDRPVRRAAVRHRAGRRPLELDQRIDIGPFYVTIDSVKQAHRAPARGGDRTRPLASWSSRIDGHQPHRPRRVRLPGDGGVRRRAHRRHALAPGRRREAARLRRRRRRPGPGGRVHQPGPDLHLRLGAPAATRHRPRRTDAVRLRLRVPGGGPADPRPEPLGPRTTARSPRAMCRSRWCRDRPPGAGRRRRSSPRWQSVTS